MTHQINFVYADDQEALHFITEMFLKRTLEAPERSVNVHHVYSGQELIDYVLTNPVDGIITDVDMPVNGQRSKSGLEAIAEIRAQGNLAKALVVTGDLTPEREAQLKASGAQGYVFKPYNPEKFGKAINTVWSEYTK